MSRICLYRARGERRSPASQYTHRLVVVVLSYLLWGDPQTYYDNYCADCTTTVWGGV